MIIDKPNSSYLPSMKALWRRAFGDEESFVDLFFDTAYSPERAFVAVENEETAAALFFFDCEYNGEKTAYIYGVATAENYRGRGLCRLLTEHAHRYLKDAGYAAALLRPAEDSLFGFYRKMGYGVCGYVREISAEAGGTAVPVRRITAEEYFEARRHLLPENGVLQEGATIRFLAGFTDTYAFDGGVFAARAEHSELFCAEILFEGEHRNAEEIFGGKRGRARTCGGEVPFVMGISLTENKLNDLYFGLVFD